MKNESSNKIKCIQRVASLISIEASKTVSPLLTKKRNRISLKQLSKPSFLSFQKDSIDENDSRCDTTTQRFRIPAKFLENTTVSSQPLSNSLQKIENTQTISYPKFSASVSKTTTNFRDSFYKQAEKRKNQRDENKIQNLPKIPPIKAEEISKDSTTIVPSQQQLEQTATFYLNYPQNHNKSTQMFSNKLIQEKVALNVRNDKVAYISNDFIGEEWKRVRLIKQPDHNLEEEKMNVDKINKIHGEDKLQEQGINQDSFIISPSLIAHSQVPSKFGIHLLHKRKGGGQKKIVQRKQCSPPHASCGDLLEITNSSLCSSTIKSQKQLKILSECGSHLQDTASSLDFCHQELLNDKSSPLNYYLQNSGENPIQFLSTSNKFQSRLHQYGNKKQDPHHTFYPTQLNLRQQNFLRQKYLDNKLDETIYPSSSQKCIKKYFNDLSTIPFNNKNTNKGDKIKTQSLRSLDSLKFIEERINSNNSNNSFNFNTLKNTSYQESDDIQQKISKLVKFQSRKFQFDFKTEEKSKYHFNKTQLLGYFY